MSFRKIAMHMQYFNSIFIITSLFLLNACHQDKLECDDLDNKIDEFKQEPLAESIVKIFKPGETLYWFIDSINDSGEEVWNEDCEVVCIADCYCGPGSIPFCDETYLDFPREIFWER